MIDSSPRSVGVCDTQPVAIEGIRALVSEDNRFEFAGAAGSIICGMDMVREQRPDVLIVDKAFGIQAIMDWISGLRSDCRVVVWGASMTEAEALRLVQAGAVGITRKSADLKSLLACLRSVAAGERWMEPVILQDTEKSSGGNRASLTSREQQVAELVEQGLKNKDIASTLGIRPGTVKIHLKHIFEKTGVRGRYGLALSGLKEKGYLPAERVI